MKDFLNDNFTLFTVLSSIASAAITCLILWIINKSKWLYREREESEYRKRIVSLRGIRNKIKEDIDTEEEKQTLLVSRINKWEEKIRAAQKARNLAFNEKLKLEEQEHKLSVTNRKLSAEIESIKKEREYLLSQMDSIEKKKRECEFELEFKKDELTRFNSIYNRIKQIFQVEHDPSFWGSWALSTFLILVIVSGGLFLTVKLNYESFVAVPQYILYILAFTFSVAGIWFISDKYRVTAKAGKAIAEEFELAFNPKEDLAKLTKSLEKIKQEREETLKEKNKFETALTEAKDKFNEKEMKLQSAWAEFESLLTQKEKLQEEIQKTEDSKCERYFELEEKLNEELNSVKSEIAQKKKEKKQIEEELEKLDGIVDNAIEIRDKDLINNWQHLISESVFKFPDDNYQNKTCKSTGDHSTLWGDKGISSLSDIPDKEDRELVAFILKFPFITGIVFYDFKFGGRPADDPYVNFTVDSANFEKGEIPGSLHTKRRSSKKEVTHVRFNITADFKNRYQQYLFLWMCGFVLRSSVVKKLH